jgi:hypothetical protein
VSLLLLNEQLVPLVISIHFIINIFNINFINKLSIYPPSSSPSERSTLLLFGSCQTWWSCPHRLLLGWPCLSRSLYNLLLRDSLCPPGICGGLGRIWRWFTWLPGSSARRWRGGIHREAGTWYSGRSAIPCLRSGSRAAAWWKQTTK